MKDALYICTRCGKQEMNAPGQPAKACEICKKEGYHFNNGLIIEVSVAATTNIQEKTHIPGIGQANVLYSTEAVQDLKFQQAAIKQFRASEPSEEEIELWNKINDRGAFGNIRTPEHTEDEIKDWQYYHKLFSQLTPRKFQEIKEKYQMHFFRDDWYNDYDDEDEWYKQ